MKRSEINKALREMEQMINSYRFSLPKFCSFTPEEWKTKGHEWDEVRDNMLGWDITDFGMGKFDEVGFSLITIRNGNQLNAEKYPKPYAEKLLYLNDGQYALNHFQDETIDYDSDVTIHVDGEVRVVPAGTQVKLEPGMSLTITQRLYHDFNVEPGTGAVLIGEVSQCNDDNTDNHFDPPAGRFPTIEEDEPPYRYLCNEYPPAPEG